MSGQTSLSSIEFFLSTGADPLNPSKIEQLGLLLGKANYSYGIAMRKFEASFRLLTREKYSILSMPAIRRNSSDLMENPDSCAVHVGFYPPESLRLLKGAYNIISFAWEFSVLRTDEMTRSPHAFARQLDMLELVDAIWTPSSYAADVIIRGLKSPKPVHFVPAPIGIEPSSTLARMARRADRRRTALAKVGNTSLVPLSIFPRYQSIASARAASMARRLQGVYGELADKHLEHLIYLTVLNPHDPRKGLLKSIDAFVRFAQENEQVLWLIKTSSHDDTNESINTRLLTHQICQEVALAGQYFSRRIFITNEAMSPDRLEALYDIADFYLCTSRAEGQNFPLQEAMARGVVPLSPSHTAMLDYVSKDNSILIPSFSCALPTEVSHKYSLLGAKWYDVESYDVYRALKASLEITREEYHKLSLNSTNIVAKKYSIEAVARRINDIIRLDLSERGSVHA